MADLTPSYYPTDIMGNNEVIVSHNIALPGVGIPQILLEDKTQPTVSPDIRYENVLAVKLAFNDDMTSAATYALLTSVEGQLLTASMILAHEGGERVEYDNTNPADREDMSRAFLRSALIPSRVNVHSLSVETPSVFKPPCSGYSVAIMQNVHYLRIGSVVSADAWSAFLELAKLPHLQALHLMIAPYEPLLIFFQAHSMLEYVHIDEVRDFTVDRPIPIELRRLKELEGQFRPLSIITKQVNTPLLKRIAIKKSPHHAIASLNDQIGMLARFAPSIVDVRFVFCPTKECAFNATEISQWESLSWHVSLVAVEFRSACCADNVNANVRDLMERLGVLSRKPPHIVAAYVRGVGDHMEGVFTTSFLGRPF